MNGLINTSSNSTAGCVWRNSLLHLCIHKTPFLAACTAGPSHQSNSTPLQSPSSHQQEQPWSSLQDLPAQSDTEKLCGRSESLHHAWWCKSSGALAQLSSEGCAKPVLLCFRQSSLPLTILCLHHQKVHRFHPEQLSVTCLRTASAVGQHAHTPTGCKPSGAQSSFFI